MKAKDLLGHTNLINIKVRLTDELLKAYKDYAGGTRNMWFIGWINMDFFMSPHSPKTKERRLYPLPIAVDTADLLECKVIKILKS